MKRKWILIFALCFCLVSSFSFFYIYAPKMIYEICKAPITEPEISKAPPQTSPNRAKDEQDYWNEIRRPDVFPVWIGGVGTLLASLAALATLAVIGVQTYTLKQQNDMIISKERARLRVEPIEFSQSPEEGFPAHLVKARVSIFGATEATIGKTVFVARLIDPVGSDTKVSWAIPMHNLPPIIRPNADPIETWTILHRTDCLLLGDEGIGDVMVGQTLVFCKGNVHYTDVFGGKWVFRFSLVWRYHRYTPGGEIFGGDWEYFGDTEANGEYPDIDHA